MKQSPSPWFGRWLRTQRDIGKVSTAKIADRLGVSVSTVLSRERGGIIIVDSLPAILNAYEIPPAAFASKLKDLRQ